MWDYSEKVKEHFFSPRNAKAVVEANATGNVGSLSCGDALKLTLKVNPETEIIEDAGFQTFGCGSAIASSSALTEIIIGKTINDALAVTNQDIADYLDGLPPEKMHCSVMGTEALHAAVADYRGESLPEDHEEGELICKCFAIDDEMIKRVVTQNKLQSLEEVIQYTKAGGACSSCHEKIEWVLEDLLVANGQEFIASASQTVATPPKKLNTLQRIRLIEAVIEEARPGIEEHGGIITLSDVEDNMVFVSMSGSCSGCGLSGSTIAMLEEKFSAALGENITVYPVNAHSH
ncbi:MAG: Fe-S cluster assembly protein NifU [Colwellia sp.]